MRFRLLCLPLVATALCAGAAFGQARSANPVGMPASSQLLGVAVGGTHVPLARPLQHVANPYEGNADAIVQGRKLFEQMHCVACHAPDGGGNMGPALSDNNWIYGGEPDQIYLTILQGRPNGMPAFGQALPPESIWKLVTYIRTLSTKASEPATAAPKHKQSGK
jgi:cytochrome c oxidase cbb3-type subunit III